MRFPKDEVRTMGFDAVGDPVRQGFHCFVILAQVCGLWTWSPTLLMDVNGCMVSVGASCGPVPAEQVIAHPLTGCW